MTTVINIYHKKSALTTYTFIGRSTKSTKHFGNPFKIPFDGNRNEVCDKFEKWLSKEGYEDIEPERRLWILRHIYLLKDKTLGCYCKPLRCHGDYYCKLLNQEE